VWLQAVSSRYDTSKHTVPDIPTSCYLYKKMLRCLFTSRPHLIFAYLLFFSAY
jgi:hypothetical protein